MHSEKRLKQRKAKQMKAKIKEYWFLPVYFAFAVSALIIHPLTGEEIVDFPWRTVCYLFMLLLVEEGIRKENIVLPVFRLLNSVRSTPFMFFLLLLSAFLLSLFLFPFMVVLIMVPFTIRLLGESRKEKYTVSAAAMITLISVTSSLFTPFSPANLYLFLDTDVSYTTYMPSLLIPYGISFAICVIEAFVLYRGTKGDEIYLHIENEEYWDRERRGMRILYIAFFLVILFGRRFNTIDLLLVVALAFLILDRGIYKKINWALFLTLASIVLSGYVLSKTGVTENRIIALVTSVLLTRLGSYAAGIGTEAALPSVILSLSFSFIYALREMKEQRKAFIKEYILLAFPHLIVFFIFFMLS